MHIPRMQARHLGECVANLLLSCYTLALFVPLDTCPSHSCAHVAATPSGTALTAGGGMGSYLLQLGTNALGMAWASSLFGGRYEGGCVIAHACTGRPCLREHHHMCLSHTSCSW